MRSCVKTSIPASGITSSVTGTFFQNNNNNKDIVTASGNTLTLTSWCFETNSLRLRYETTLPGRICALDKIVLSSNNSSNKESHSSSSSASVFTPSDLLVALYSETHLAVMRWSQKDHSFKNVALFALSVEDVDGAVPVVDGISSERSAGLPPLLRVDRERNMILVLAQRRYIHSISLTVVLHHHHHNNSSIAKTLHQDAAAPNSNINNTKTQQEQQKPKKKAVAWADEDESSSSSSDEEEPTDQDEATTTKNNQESNLQSSLSTPAPSFFEQEDYFYKNQLTFYPPKTFDLLSHIKTARNVRDVHFVHGFSEPTIAILREASATWAGRVRLMTAGSSIIRALSCGVVIANIDDVSEKITVVREIDGLPYSSSQLCPLPAGTMASLGGVLCFSANSVSHVTFRGSAYSAIINKLGRDESSADQSGNIRWGDIEFAANNHNNNISNATNPNSSASAQEKINAKRAQLAAARAGHLKTFSDITVVALSETSVFVSHAEDGSCDILDLSSTDNKTVSSIRCTSLPATSVVGAAATLNTIPVSSSANVSSMMIFLGSKIHDSFLLSYSCSSSNNSASSSSSSIIQQQQHKCSILGGFNKSLASAVDMDVVEYNPTDSALIVEMNRYSSEKAKARQLLLLAEKENSGNKEKTIDNPAASQDASLQKIKSDSAAAAIVMNPYGDLVSTDAPVLRPPPKPLAARIKASAILVAAGALQQHSHVTALRQHATIDVVHRQNMDCTAIFSLATQDPSAISQNNLEGKRLRDQYLQQQQSQQRNGSQTYSNAEKNLLRNPETVVLLFGAAASTAVVGTFGGKLTQISAAESAFACNERTISAFELGFFDSTPDSTCDIFLQLTSKSLNLISFKPNAGTTPKEKFARIDTILCPSTIANTIDDEASFENNNNNNNLNSFRQAVVVSHDLSALVLTDQGSLHLIQVKKSNDTNGTIDVCFDEQEDLSREILPNSQDKIKFMATLSLANRRSSSTQTEDFENSFVLFATEQNHLYICSIEMNKNNSTKSALSLIAVFSNFFVDFPTSALFQQHQNQNRNHGSSSSSSTSQIDGMLLCRMHGNSIGIPDDHLTLVIRRVSGEISVYGLSNLPAATTTIKLWRKLSLLHDIDKTSASVVEKFETMAEKKRKKELLLEQQQLQQDSSFAINHSNITNNSTSPSSLPLGCVRLCYIPNAAGAETDGIFVCGGTQSQIIVSDRGFARCHPIRCPNGSGDGVHSLVRCGAPVNCKALSNGLVLCEVASVVLGRVQGQQTDSSSSLSLDLRTPWPSRRIPLPGTPHFVVYNSSNNCAVAVTSTLQPYRPTTAPYDTALKGSSSSSSSASAVSALAALVVEHAVINETEGVPIPCQKRFKLQLLCSGAGWSLGGSYDLLENEVVLSCHNGLVNRSQSNAQSPSLLVEPGAAEYVVVGTAFPQGDDVACRGRLLIFGVALHSGTRQLHLVHAENTKAPISAVTTIGGLIIAAVGSSIRMCALDPSGKSSLITCAFLSYATYITSLTAMKDFLVVGDIFQSVSLVSVRAAHTQGGEHDTGEERIVLVAQDAFSREITATGFVSSQSEATILGCDSRDNLLALHYEPPRSAVLMAEEKKHRMMTRMNNNNEDGGNNINNNNDDNNNMNHFGSNNNAAATSNVRGGIIPVTPLQLVQNYKLSGSITKMLRLRSPTPSTLSSFTGDNCSVYLTLDGEIGFVLPLSDKEFRILRWATTQHTAECENVGGLHVEAERTGRHSEVVMLQGAPMLDLHHIQDAFVSGSGNVLRKNVARRAGTTSDKMLSMLAKVHESFVEPMF